MKRVSFRGMSRNLGKIEGVKNGKEKREVEGREEEGKEEGRGREEGTEEYPAMGNILATANHLPANHRCRMISTFKTRKSTIFQTHSIKEDFAAQ